MSKHTPGPWEVNSIFANKIITADTKSEIAWAIILSDHDETIANACLIAAAPDLLDALKYLTEFIEQAYPNATEWVRYTKARAAIAKATGEQA